MSAELDTRIRERLRDIPDFPKPGIVFKDITPVLGDAALLRDIVAAFVVQVRPARIDRVAGIESRGFIFGAPLAVALGAGFAPLRKVGKLPHTTLRIEYALEYGASALEAHTDAVRPGEHVLIVDDVLATGGTAAAAVDLVRQLGGVPVALAVLLELAFLKGRDRLDGVPLHTLSSFAH